MMLTISCYGPSGTHGYNGTADKLELITRNKLETKQEEGENKHNSMQKSPLLIVFHLQSWAIDSSVFV